MNIVFLDIDGPMISTPQLIQDPAASSRRSLMNQNSVAWINSICKLADAKIVTNSSHNYYDVPSHNHITRDMVSLKTSLVHHGIKPDYFHDDWRTLYGDYKASRLSGFGTWIAKHNPSKYVIFDDMDFTDDSGLVLINFDDGITGKDYKRALDIFEVKRGLIIL